MKTRRDAREHALQALYFFDTTGQWSEEDLTDFERLFIDSAYSNSPILPFFRKLVLGVSQYRHTLDSQIEISSDRWRLDRMATVDRNIIRIAAYELNYESEIPVRVAINEAIEIAKNFGDPQSPGFVNGILDNIATRIAAFDSNENLAHKARRNRVASR
jgi:N utilization substance protein B